VALGSVWWVCVSVQETLAKRLTNSRIPTSRAAGLSGHGIVPDFSSLAHAELLDRLSRGQPQLAASPIKAGSWRCQRRVQRHRQIAGNHRPQGESRILKQLGCLTKAVASKASAVQRPPCSRALENWCPGGLAEAWGLRPLGWRCLMPKGRCGLVDQPVAAESKGSRHCANQSRVRLRSLRGQQSPPPRGCRGLVESSESGRSHQRSLAAAFFNHRGSEGHRGLELAKEQRQEPSDLQAGARCFETQRRAVRANGRSRS